MKKECNIVMLATDNPSNIVQIHPDTISYTTTESISGGEYQHLHITSDEEIKEGDWIYNPYSKYKIYKANDFNKDHKGNEFISGYTKKDCKKIIATTDILGISPFGGQDILEVPQIPQSFIDTFIEEYNKGNVIDKVLVEYEEGKIEHPLLEPFPNNLSYADELGHWNRLKTNFDNTINISLIEEEKKYSRSEVKQEKESILVQYAEEHGLLSGKQDIEQFNKWIKENLK